MERVHGGKRFEDQQINISQEKVMASGNNYDDVERTRKWEGCLK